MSTTSTSAASLPASTSNNNTSSSSKPNSNTSTTANSPPQPGPPTHPAAIASARTAIEASILNHGSQLDHAFTSRATLLHTNNTALSVQETQLLAATKSLAKETDKLKKVADEAGSKLKELGNVQNWAEVLEREFLVLEETARLVELGDGEEDGGEGEELCDVCGEDLGQVREEKVVWCQRCDRLFHTGCVGMSWKPRGLWVCGGCQRERERGKEHCEQRQGTGEDQEDVDVVMGGLESCMQAADGSWSVR